MALSVVVDTSGGLSGLPENVIRQGLKALKMELAEADQPEVIVVCDLLAVGSAVRIPGVRTIGIAAQGDDQPILPLSVPCVAGAANLLRSAASEQIVIVDGNDGVVILDPDVRTVVRYQNALAPQPAGRVFLESAHIPAHTQDGRLVSVAGLVSSIAEAELAIGQGADSLVVRLAQLVDEETKAGRADLADPHVEMLQTLLALAAGKPLLIVLVDPEERLVELADRFAAPGQVRFIDAADEPEALSEPGIRAAVSSGSDRVTVPADAVADTKDLIRSLPGEDDGRIDGATAQRQAEGSDPGREQEH
jgi:hypothetical protein